MSDGEEQWLDDVDPEVLRRRRGRIALILGGLLLFSAAGVLAYWLRPDQSDAAKVPLAAQYAISRQLNDHGALHFNPPAEAQVVAVSKSEFLVRGWVTDLASDGRKRSYWYSVIVVEGASDYTFRDISVVEQY
jgi:hypothetical protein